PRYYSSEAIARAPLRAVLSTFLRIGVPFEQWGNFGREKRIEEDSGNSGFDGTAGGHAGNAGCTERTSTGNGAEHGRREYGEVTSQHASQTQQERASQSAQASHLETASAGAVTVGAVGCALFS